MYRSYTHAIGLVVVVSSFACSDAPGNGSSSGAASSGATSSGAGATSGAAGGSTADGGNSGVGASSATGGGSESGGRGGGCADATGGACSSATVGGGGTTSTTSGSGGESSANGGAGGAPSSATVGSGGGCCNDCGCNGGSGSGGDSGTGAGGTAGGDAGGDLLWLSDFPFTDYASEGTTTSVGAFDVSADGAGNVFVVGKFNHSIDFGGGLLTAQDSESGDTFLLELDVTGQHIWSTSSVSGQPRAIATDAAGNAYVVGSGNDWLGTGAVDPYVLKIDGSGNVEWVHHHTDRRFADVAVAADGSVYVAGTLGQPFTDAADLLVDKLDPTTGNIVWQYTVAHPGPQQVDGLSVSAAGVVAIVGSYAGSPDLGGGALSGPAGAYVAVIGASTGAHLWSEGFAGTPGLGGVPTDVSLYRVGTDASGAVVVLGTHPTGDFGTGPNPVPAAFTSAEYLVRFSAAGQAEWTHGLFHSRAPGTTVRFSSLGVASSGAVYLSALLEGDYDFGGGLTPVGTLGGYGVVAAWTAGGSFDWTTSFATTGEDGGTFGQSSLALDPDQHPIFAAILQQPSRVTVAELAP